MSKKLEEVLAGRLPFHLIPRDLREQYRQQLKGEIRFFIWEGDKKSLEPRKFEFETSFLNLTDPEIIPELTDSQMLAIRQRIETAWAGLFYPPPHDCAKDIVHGYLHEPLRHKALEFLDSITLSQQEIQDLLTDQNFLEKRIDELGRKISKLEGIDRDGTLAYLKQELQGIQDRLDKLADDARTYDRKINALEAQIASQKAEYERERQQLDDSSPVRALIEKSERVRKVIDTVIPALFPLKVKELAKAMTTVYRQLAHKDQVEKIDIDEDGTTRVLSKSGKEIYFERSAGENQIFATALIAGLAKVSGAKAPMVVDTPLGRLDSKHRRNILSFWTSDKNRQVILLSQDEEIDHELFKQIEESVNKTYLLEHIDVGDGIGRTTAKDGYYFTGRP